MALYAIPNGPGWTVGTLEELFPNSAHPNAEFLSANGCYEVSVGRFHDGDTEQTVQCAPYLENGVVYTVAVVPLTTDQLASKAASAQAKFLKLCTDTIQAQLDAFAQTRGYDGIKSACAYVGCSVTSFDTEGTYCRDKMAETWATCYTIMGEVQAQTRAMPTLEELLAELPTLTWPT